MNAPMSRAELLALPPVIGIVTAGRVLGFGRTKSYELARTGEFPCRVIRVGRSYLVPTAVLLAVLGLEPNRPPLADVPDDDSRGAHQ
ncbi:hypothetical protein GCM10010156_64620 [Planobispora rosea]|uniref:Helix-turn-helix domain-containing protein n=1 Tax=Planobispora rosea TaxID=35762 RepID=A0A8J3WFV9_PLARO|nr:DNA-binding protein [Planobispora rosea]GGS97499.1 hypothetical protein GCM10010156_64620 [Planobispora rosea]GIH87860.1 hypothetical protein Pro02_62680 [Planobispora rosea]